MKSKKITAFVAGLLLVSGSSAAMAQTAGSAAQKLSVAGAELRAGAALEGESSIRGERGGAAAVIFPLVVGLALIVAAIVFDDDAESP